MSIKVLIACTTPVITSGLQYELNQHADIVVVGNTADTGEILELIAAHQPNVVLIQADIWEADTHTLREELKRLKIIVFIPNCTLPRAREMISDGVNSILLYEEPPEIIARAVREVMLGRTYLSSSVVTELVERSDVGEAIMEYREMSKLSPRELEVIKFVTKGHTNAAIANELCISVRTVRFHMENIFEKLGVNNRTEAAMIAIKCWGQRDQLE